MKDEVRTIAMTREVLSELGTYEWHRVDNIYDDNASVICRCLCSFVGYGFDMESFYDNDGYHDYDEAMKRKMLEAENLTISFAGCCVYDLAKGFYQTGDWELVLDELYRKIPKLVEEKMMLEGATKRVGEMFEEYNKRRRDYRVRPTVDQLLKEKGITIKISCREEFFSNPDMNFNYYLYEVYWQGISVLYFEHHKEACADVYKVYRISPGEWEDEFRACIRRADSVAQNGERQYMLSEVERNLSALRGKL